VKKRHWLIEQMRWPRILCRFVLTLVMMAILLVACFRVQGDPWWLHLLALAVAVLGASVILEGFDA
jgi:hypothetical protein